MSTKNVKKEENRAQYMLNLQFQLFYEKEFEATFQICSKGQEDTKVLNLRLQLFSKRRFEDAYGISS